MKINEVNDYLNCPVWFKNNEYVLTGCVTRKDKETGELVYSAELRDTESPDSLIYARLDEVSYIYYIIEHVFEKYYDDLGVTEFTMPDGVTRIASCAFKEYHRIASVTIPKGVHTIEIEAFNCCTNLKSVYIPETVKRIEWYAFAKCTSLTSIKLPCHLSSIGDGAFYKCESLTSVEIPDTIEEFHDFFGLWKEITRVFAECKNLRSIKLGMDSNFVIADGALWTKGMSEKLFDLALK